MNIHGTVDLSGADRDTASFRGEFHRIAEQGCQDFLHRRLVGEQVRARRRFGGDADLLGIGGRLDILQRSGNNVVNFEVLAVKMDASGFQPRHFQHIGDDSQEIMAALVDMVAVINVSRCAQLAENLLLHHFGKADDGIKGRPQFMAHIGQKARFCEVGSFGLGFLLQIFLSQIRQLLRLQFQRLAGMAQIGNRAGQATL